MKNLCCDRKQTSSNDSCENKKDCTPLSFRKNMEVDHKKFSLGNRSLTRLQSMKKTPGIMNQSNQNSEIFQLNQNNSSFMRNQYNIYENVTKNTEYYLLNQSLFMNKQKQNNFLQRNSRKILTQPISRDKLRNIQFQQIRNNSIAGTSLTSRNQVRCSPQIRQSIKGPRIQQQQKMQKLKYDFSEKRQKLIKKVEELNLRKKNLQDNYSKQREEMKKMTNVITEYFSK